MAHERYRPPSARLSSLEEEGNRALCFKLFALGLMLTGAAALCSEYLGRFILHRADVLDDAEWNQAWIDTIVVHYFLGFLAAAASGSIGRVLAGRRWIPYSTLVGLGFVLVEAFFRWQAHSRRGTADGILLMVVVDSGVPALVLVVLASLASALLAGRLLRQKHASR